MSVDDEGKILGEGGGDEAWGACVGVWRLSGVWAAGEVGDAVVFFFVVADDDDASSATLAGGEWVLLVYVGGLFVRVMNGHGGWLSWVVCGRVAWSKGWIDDRACNSGGSGSVGERV